MRLSFREKKSVGLNGGCRKRPPRRAHEYMPVARVSNITAGHRYAQKGGRGSRYGGGGAIRRSEADLKSAAATSSATKARA